MRNYHTLLQGLLTSKSTSCVEETQTLTDMEPAKSRFSLWSDEYNEILDNPLVYKILFEVGKYLRVKGSNWFKGNKKKDENTSVVTQMIMYDLEQQVIRLESFIQYYTSLDTAILSDLTEPPNPFPSPFSLDIYNRYSEKDYSSTFNKGQLTEFKGIYGKLISFEMSEASPEILLSYKLDRNQLAPNESFYNFELLKLQERYRSITCRGIQDFRYVIIEIESFIKDIK